MLSPSNKAVVLGSGSWGTALAMILAEHFTEVIIVSRCPNQADEVCKQHTNSRYLPQVNNPIAVLSGPNHAEEVAQQLATCTVVGSIDKELASNLQKFFCSKNFRTYTSQDVAGMELGGALKNVFAIAAGIAAGIGLGDNAIAALVTRGLAEMTRLGIALGGQPDTFMGLSGVGDLMTTCYSKHSRNNRVGMALGKGLTLQEACDELGMVAEGVPNTQSIYEAARETDIDTPIIDAVYNVIYHNKPAQQAVQELLTRDPKAE